MKVDNIISIILVALGIFVFSYSYSIGIGRLNSPGPGLFPFLLGLMLFVFSLYKFKGAMRRREKTEEKKEGPLLFGKLIFLLLSLLFYALFLNTLGYILTTIIALTFVFRIAGYKNWLKILTYSIIIMFISYFLFTYVGVRFPQGILRRL